MTEILHHPLDFNIDLGEAGIQHSRIRLEGFFVEAVQDFFHPPMKVVHIYIHTRTVLAKVAWQGLLSRACLARVPGSVAWQGYLGKDLGQGISVGWLGRVASQGCFAKSTGKLIQA